MKRDSKVFPLNRQTYLHVVSRLIKTNGVLAAGRVFEPLIINHSIIGYRKKWSAPRETKNSRTDHVQFVEDSL